MEEKGKGRKGPERKRRDRARNPAACLLARVIMNLYLALERFRDRRHTTFLSRFACLLRILINENAAPAAMRSLFEKSFSYGCTLSTLRKRDAILADKICANLMLVSPS